MIVVERNTKRTGGSAIDGRTTRHLGYALSQRKRKCIEQCFDPAVFAKAAAMFGMTIGDHRLDTAIAQRTSMSLEVVTATGIDHTRSLQ